MLLTALSALVAELLQSWPTTPCSDSFGKAENCYFAMRFFCWGIKNPCHLAGHAAGRYDADDKNDFCILLTLNKILLQ